jgi:hypothetical protein
MQQDKAIIKCEYAMAAFSTGNGASLIMVGLKCSWPVFNASRAPFMYDTNSCQGSACITSSSSHLPAQMSAPRQQQYINTCCLLIGKCAQQNLCDT